MEMVTSFIFKKIKRHFYKFQKANKQLQLFDKRGHEIIIYNLISRYKNVSTKIFNSQIGKYQVLLEFAKFMDIARSVFLVNYYSKISFQDNYKLFSIFVLKKIKKLFVYFKNYYRESNAHFGAFRDFTVVLLLKLKMVATLIEMNYTTVDKYLMVQSVGSQYQPIIKFYLEMQDDLLSIPHICEQQQNSKSCYKNYLHDYLIQTFDKY